MFGICVVRQRAFFLAQCAHCHYFCLHGLVSVCCWRTSSKSQERLLVLLLSKLLLLRVCVLWGDGSSRDNTLCTATNVTIYLVSLVRTNGLNKEKRWNDVQCSLKSRRMSERLCEGEAREPERHSSVFSATQPLSISSSCVIFVIEELKIGRMNSRFLIA